MDAEEYWPADAFPRIGEAGFFGITVPELYGGAGADLVAGGLVLQAFRALESCAGAELGRA